MKYELPLLPICVSMAVSSFFLFLINIIVSSVGTGLITDNPIYAFLPSLIVISTVFPYSFLKVLCVRNSFNKNEIDDLELVKKNYLKLSTTIFISSSLVVVVFLFLINIIGKSPVPWISGNVLLFIIFPIIGLSVFVSSFMYLKNKLIKKILKGLRFSHIKYLFFSLLSVIFVVLINMLIISLMETIQFFQPLSIIAIFLLIAFGPVTLFSIFSKKLSPSPLYQAIISMLFPINIFTILLCFSPFLAS